MHLQSPTPIGFAGTFRQGTKPLTSTQQGLTKSYFQNARRWAETGVEENPIADKIRRVESRLTFYACSTRVALFTFK
jgi:hypothetical protein